MTTKQQGSIEMTDTLAVDADDIEAEESSTIRSGFIRWLIVAGVMITFLFVYMMFSMMSEQQEKQIVQAELEEVPQQVHDASSNSSVDAVKRSIGGVQRTPKPEPMQDLPINPAFAPQQMVQQQIQRQAPKVEPEETNRQLSAYEQYQEDERLRAMQSYTATDTIGNPKAFYDKGDEEQKPEAPVKPQEAASAAEKRMAASQQRQEISNYIDALKSGAVDASAPPPAALLQGIGRIP